MRWLTAVTAVLASTVAVVQAQSASQMAAIEAELAELFPACAIPCLEEMIPQSPCGLTDIDCTCNDAELQLNITGCVSGVCTTYESLAAMNGSKTMCGAEVRDAHEVQGLVPIIGCSITFVVYVLRILAKLKTLTRQLAWEDYFITTAMTITIITSCFHATAASHGVGKDIWTLTPGEIQESLKWFLMTEIAYYAATGFVKLSMLSLMLRIIPDKQFRLYVFITMGFTVAYTLTFVIGTLFQCQPIAYMWMQLDDAYDGRCNHINIQAEASVAINIVLDLVIMALPLPSLWGLQLTLVKKLTVISMFLLGIFVTIISCIRLEAFVAFASSFNFTWDYKDGGNWSLAELYAGIICACLPSLRPLLAILRIKVNSSSAYKTGSSPYASNYAAGGSQHLRSGNHAAGLQSSNNKIKAAKPPVHGDEGGFVRLHDIEIGPDNSDESLNKHYTAGSKNILATTTTNLHVNDAPTQTVLGESPPLGSSYNEHHKGWN